MNTQPLPRLNIPKKASKADVRSMLGLQAKDDAYWSKFEVTYVGVLLSIYGS